MVEQVRKELLKDSAPKTRRSFLTGVKRKMSYAMKGLPYVRMKNKELSSKDYGMRIPGYGDLRYETLLWLILTGTNAIFLSILFPCFFDKSFGSNFSTLMAYLAVCYILDFVTKTVQRMVSTQNPVQFRLSGMVDDLMCVFFTVMIPTTHTLLTHIAAVTVRDVSIAAGADLFRLYFWPDNEHNRKRVANLSQIINRYGLEVWFYMFKTPWIRGFISYVCVEKFIQPDTGFDLMRVLTFPMKVIAYELVNDFFYYWMHRYLHENQWLYEKVHKLHHESKCPTAINSSTMTITETLITFVLTDWVTPLILAPYIPFTMTEYGIFSTWICSIEVYGHSGHILDCDEPSVWRMGLSSLLQTLGVQLEAKDHELHHWNNDFNYCKRTQLWDKLFGTFDWHNSQKAANVSLEEKKPEEERKELDKPKVAKKKESAL
jgi:sterol desaturase/sphingolipid hydroxylase (fatty acid hydroxylase superfamily)